MQPIFGGTLRLWWSNLTFLHRLVACLASQEWDQPMREYIQTIRAGKGEGHQLIQVIWVSFDKLDFWDYKQVGWFFFFLIDKIDKGVTTLEILIHMFGAFLIIPAAPNTFWDCLWSWFFGSKHFRSWHYCRKC